LIIRRVLEHGIKARLRRPQSIKEGRRGRNYLKKVQPFVKGMRAIVVWGFGTKCRKVRGEKGIPLAGEGLAIAGMLRALHDPPKGKCKTTCSLVRSRG